MRKIHDSRFTIIKCAPRIASQLLPTEMPSRSAKKQNARMRSVAVTGDGDGTDIITPRALPNEVASAAVRDEMATVVSWLDGGGHVDATYESADDPDGSFRGNTLIMLTSGCGHAPLVDMLLQRKASLDLQNGGMASAR